MDMRCNQCHEDIGYCVCHRSGYVPGAWESKPSSNAGAAGLVAAIIGLIAVLIPLFMMRGKQPGLAAGCVVKKPRPRVVTHGQSTDAMKLVMSKKLSLQFNK